MPLYIDMQLLALYGVLTWSHLSGRPDYILVIDCGSTGTRMCVFPVATFVCSPFLRIF